MKINSNVVQTLARSFVKFFAAWLVTRGFMDDTNAHAAAQAATGFILGAAGVVWGLIHRTSGPSRMQKKYVLPLPGFFFVAAPLALLLLTGCTITDIKHGETTFHRVSFGTKVSVPEVSLSPGTNGVPEFNMKGYSNDAAQALGAIVEGAVKGALQGAK